MPVPAAAEARTGFGARLLAPLYLSVTLNPVNSAILATALTDIGASLGVGLAAASTLVAALYLVSAVAQPFLGRLAERYGARRVLLAGHLLVLAGAAVAMAAPSLPWLLAARCLIGAGTSAAYPCAMAIVRARADERGGEVPRGVLGGLAMCNQLAVALGLAFGGVLVGAGGWRWTFAVNLPLAALAIVTTLLYVPATRGGPVRGRTALGALDPLGVLLFTVAVTSGFLVLHAFPAPSPYALAVCAASSVALVAWELRAAAPFVDVRALAATPALLWTHLRNALTYVTVYSVLYGFGAWLGSRGGYPPGTAGLLLLPISLGGAAASALAGRMRAPGCRSCCAARPPPPGRPCWRWCRPAGAWPCPSPWPPCSAWPWGWARWATSRRSTSRALPPRPPPRRGCCARPCTSARPSPRPSSRSSSARPRPAPPCATWPSSCSSSAPR
ncbi:MFS transporter [Thermocatellispora tengchongensis]|uniref:MFS transporter n=1 Tax=Thermocatellispora tengchongensis TaxID=1073253 RepID=UPI0036324AE6